MALEPSTTTMEASIVENGIEIECKAEEFFTIPAAN